MDIVIRAAVAFLFVFLLTRIIGRRELNSLEPFDLILLVMMGDLVQQGVTQNDFSVTGLLLAGGTVGILTVCTRSEEHTSELQSLTNLVCRLLLEKKKKKLNMFILVKKKKKKIKKPI